MKYLMFNFREGIENRKWHSWCEIPYEGPVQSKLPEKTINKTEDNLNKRYYKCSPTSVRNSLQ